MDKAEDDEMVQTIARWWAIWKHAHEVGALAQKQLLVMNAISADQRLFFTKEERRMLTRTNVS